MEGSLEPTQLKSRLTAAAPVPPQLNPREDRIYRALVSIGKGSTRAKRFRLPVDGMRVGMYLYLVQFDDESLLELTRLNGRVACWPEMVPIALDELRFLGYITPIGGSAYLVRVGPGVGVSASELLLPNLARVFRLLGMGGL